MNLHALFKSPQFRQALFDVQTAECERYAASAVPVTFSPAFERRMERLIRVRRKPYYPLISTRPRRILLSFAVILLLLLSMVFSVSALREPVVRFIVEVYEKFSQVFFRQQPEEEQHFPVMLETYYAPTWLPEGYSEDVDQMIDVIIFCERTYVSEADEEIMFKQHTITSPILQIDTEDVQARQVAVNGSVGLVYSNKDIQRLMWNDAQYGFFVSGPVLESELLRIAVSLQLIEKEF